MDLEEKVEKGFLEKFRSCLGEIKNSALSKVAVCSLVGILGMGGVGYSKDRTICWEKKFGTDSGQPWRIEMVQQTTDGGYIASGYRNGDKAWIVKLDARGNPKWEGAWGGGGNDNCAHSVRQTRDGGYVVAGYLNTGRFCSAVVSKLKPNGDLEWNETYGGSDAYEGDRAYSIWQTDDGRYVVAGMTHSRGEGKKEKKGAWIFELNAKGELKWEQPFGMSSIDRAYSVQQTKDRGYVVAGESHSKGSQAADALVLKFDAEKKFGWAQTYGSEQGNDIAYSIWQTEDGGYVVAGTKEVFVVAGTKEVSRRRENAWIFRLDAQGDRGWNKTFGGEDNSCGISAHSNSCKSVQQTKEGGYVAAGFLDCKAWVVKLDAQGDTEWEKSFGGRGLGRAQSVQQTKDGGYIVAGEISVKGSQDAWILKLDKDGNLECK